MRENTIQLKTHFHRFSCSRTGRYCPRNLLVFPAVEMQAKGNEPTDYCIPSAEVHDTTCGRWSYQSTSTRRTKLYASNFGTQEVTTSRAKFTKPLGFYATLTIFGPNIVASEGEEWKKYRKVVAPAFSEVSASHLLSREAKCHCQRNNKLVWGVTTHIMMDLFDNVWGDRSEIVVDHCVDITLPVRYYLYLLLFPCLKSPPDCPFCHRCSR